MKRMLTLCLILLAMAANARAEEAPLILLTEQRSQSIVLIALDGRDITERWRFTPTSENGFDASGFVYPSDARLRLYEGKQVVLTCASGGLCAVVGYPEGERIWSVAVPQADNPHAMELTPDGCVAMAASSGNYVRLYSRDEKTYAEALLPGAHGLWWDPHRSVLWAIGTTYLTSYALTGTPDAPKLEERMKSRARLPIQDGHDIWPVYGQENRLWVVCSGLFQYDMETRKWHADHGFDMLRASNIKSAATSPDGAYAIRTVPNGAFRAWNTNVLDVLLPGQTNITPIDLGDFAVYRARFFIADYR